MPLAVAAVANLTDIPTNDLISFITSLNQAAVPAPQFVEVVRYSPVVFYDDSMAPQFVTFVTAEVDRGIRGDALASSIADRYRTIGIRDIDVARPPRTIFVDRTEFFPPVVRTRIAEVRTHPHGGPPGQLKKSLGLQTGAEVVHGTAPRERVVVSRNEHKSHKPQKTVVVHQEPRREVERQVTPHPHEKSEGSPKKNQVVVSAPIDRGHGNRGHQMTMPSGGPPVTRKAGGNEGHGHADKGNSPGKGKGKGKGN